MQHRMPAERHDTVDEIVEYLHIGRATQMLEEEMDFLGPVRLSEVEAIQQQIVDIVRRLEETGEITVGGGAEGADEFIS